jgi:hypothetical protein
MVVRKVGNKGLLRYNGVPLLEDLGAFEEARMDEDHSRIAILREVRLLFVCITKQEFNRCIVIA